MKKPIGALAIAVLLTGCANAPPVVASRDDFLSMAGFTQLPRTSPTFVNNVATLPRHRFVHHTVNGVTTYYYLDPTICGCLYTGTAANWATYRQLVSDKMHMDAQQFLQEADTPMDTGGG
jgi:hypothetical protein